MLTGETSLGQFNRLTHWLTDWASFAVATVMFSTTTLIAVQMIYVKHWPIVVAVAFFLFYGFIDGVFIPSYLVVPSFLMIARYILGSIFKEDPIRTLRFFCAGFLSTDTIYVGCLGPSHAGLNIDDTDALLDMGQGTEVRRRVSFSAVNSFLKLATGRSFRRRKQTKSPQLHRRG